MNDNIILEKSYKSALLIVRLYRKLTEEKHEYVLSKAMLTDGTFVGAHVEAAQEAEPGGFGRQMNTTLLKAGRAKYWLNVLHDGGFLDDVDFQPAYDDFLELKRLLGKITRTTRGY